MAEISVGQNVANIFHFLALEATAPSTLTTPTLLQSKAKLIRPIVKAKGNTASIFDNKLLDFSNIDWKTKESKDELKSSKQNKKKLKMGKNKEHSRNLTKLQKLTCSKKESKTLEALQTTKMGGYG